MIKRIFLFFVISCFTGAACLLASPSGLNNIPTEDIVPMNKLVFQGYFDTGKGNRPDYFIGAKLSPLENLEIGIDGRIFPEPGLEESVTFQGKYRFNLTDKVAFAVGISNLGDRARTGWENYYGVVGYDFGYLRAHLGGSLQHDNEGVFAGIDKAIKCFDRDLTLRSDIIQTNDGDDVTSSLGFIYDIGNNLLFESWVSFPTESGREDVYTFKLNYVVDF